MNQDRREQVRPFLRAGEHLVAVCAYELAPGVPTPPEELLPPEDHSALHRRIEAKLPKPLAQLVRNRVDPRRSRPAAADRPAHAVDQPGARPQSGTSMEGGWESAAGHFLISRAGARGSVDGVLAVTDRRWFGLTDVSHLWQSTPVMKEYWEVPRSAVAAVRARPTGALQRGRMDLEFADLSWVALLASVPGQAVPFAEAAAHYR
ncbi:hypothetical protein ACGFY6_17635 [Streptomyces sp. NPDC048387]|uniref:hypothetical protein n=1 Tax=unclassified Streptomyces TaxID=2593676 RepID=UPI00340CA545